ncbi:MAG: radical SAM protein [Thermodesulfobacteriota bacterium]
MLLVHPPLAKACEAPGGLARLAGALRCRGVACRVWDANAEGQLALMESAARAGGEAEDTWTRRASRRLGDHRASLRSWDLYRSPDRYRRAVSCLNRLLESAAEPFGVRLSLADYESEALFPVRSADLLESAASPAANPFHRWFRGRIPEILAQWDFSHVGFSVNYLSQALTAFAMIGLIRREYPHLKIVLGGGLVTSWLRHRGGRPLFAGWVDTAVSGPGEGPLLALMEKSRDGGCERPDFGDFPLADYLAPGTVLPYSASEGCWWRRCSFCPEPAEGNPYQPVPPERVRADLHALTAKEKPALIHLLDNALSPALLKELGEHPPGAPWYAFTRVTHHLADRQLCLRLKESGCVMLKLGLESGDQAVLDALNKGVDLQTASAVLDSLKVAGIATYVYLLFGTPAESPAAARRTLDFTAAHADCIDFLNLALFNLPAGGPGSEALDRGAFYEGDLSLYRPFVHPQGWNRGEVRRFLEKEFKRNPGIAEILRRTPPYFTSNHAPFFIMASPR